MHKERLESASRDGAAFHPQPVPVSDCCIDDIFWKTEGILRLHEPSQALRWLPLSDADLQIEQSFVRMFDDGAEKGQLLSCFPHLGGHFFASLGTRLRRWSLKAANG
jgi:hypothetical protein